MEIRNSYEKKSSLCQEAGIKQLPETAERPCQEIKHTEQMEILHF